MRAVLIKPKVTEGRCVVKSSFGRPVPSPGPRRDCVRLHCTIVKAAHDRSSSGTTEAQPSSRMARQQSRIRRPLLMVNDSSFKRTRRLCRPDALPDTSSSTPVASRHGHKVVGNPKRTPRRQQPSNRDLPVRQRVRQILRRLIAVSIVKPDAVGTTNAPLSVRSATSRLLRKNPSTRLRNRMKNAKATPPSGPYAVQSLRRESLSTAQNVMAAMMIPSST